MVSSFCEARIVQHSYIWQATRRRYEFQHAVSASAIQYRQYRFDQTADAMDADVVPEDPLRAKQSRFEKPRDFTPTIHVLFRSHTVSIHALFHSHIVSSYL